MAAERKGSRSLKPDMARQNTFSGAPGVFLPLIILESDANRRGDLFGRLMGDLFAALGYESFRFNIHKSGREIDLEGEHRQEARRVIAECKATESPIGGDDLNKFYGVLDIEKRKVASSKQISGYFVSLSGFTETAIEQEREAKEPRFVCLNGAEAIAELVKGRIIVSEARALEIAGPCVSEQHLELSSEASAQLLAHRLGWIWAIYFGLHMERTHLVLVHADGIALSNNLAQIVVDADQSVGGILHSLKYIAPIAGAQQVSRKLELTQRKYFEYIAKECGEVQLEGLPADQDLGSRRLRLENIFVPLHLVAPSDEAAKPKEVEQPGAARVKRKKAALQGSKKRESIGKVLTQVQRLAVLGLPGGGKSTLLKRLAIAYAFPDRRNLIHDELPDRNWLPLFIRCRQLESQVRSPITEILGDVRKRAEIGIELAEAFSELVGRALHSGAALLLIDGLDEISDEGDRLAFVQQLRTFLAIYPAVAVVMTCRDAGFRNIAGAVSGHCVQRRLADFNNADMRRLTVAWHKEVVGNREEVIAEAVKLAETICRTDRVRRLAQNPLLLTALLLVKRWVGQMPTKRSVLYGKAVEVLLMTWNVEGHEPIDAEEAIPQLEFVAYTMMKDGTQRISVCRLAEILSAARQQMPEILGYTRVSVQDFIQRVELRSSLLMLSGFEIEEGTLRPMYEFRHLTFQEYLTARAISDGHYPDRRDSDTALDLLRPHLQDESWEEVVLLSAVLVGRKVGALVSHLIAEVQEQRPHSDPEMAPAGLLAKCIIDEIQIPPDLLREALKWVARRNEEETLPIHVPDLFQRTSPFIKSDVRHLAMSAMWAVVWLLRAKTSLKAAALAVFKAALVLAFYLRAPWPDNELAQLIATHTGAGENRNQLLQALGAEGAAQLEKISIAEKAIGRSAQAN